MKKKIISFCLATIMMLSLCSTAFAETTIPHSIDGLEKYVDTITPQRAERLSVPQLQSAAQMAKTDAEANVILDAMLDKVDQGVMSVNAVTDTYVSITSATQSNSAVTIRYSIISRVPAGAYLELGVKYPASTRIPAKIKNLSSLSVGTYTETISASGAVGKQVYTKFTARDYTNTSVYTTLYLTTSPTYDYHTITAADFLAYFTVMHAAPLLLPKINASSKIIKFAAVSIEVAGIGYTLANGLNITKSLPNPVVGQYYQTQTWYNNNKVYTRIKVWSSNGAYTRNETPLYDSGNFVAISLPGF